MYFKDMGVTFLQKILIGNADDFGQYVFYNTYPLFDPMGTGNRWNSSRPIQTTPIDKKCQGLN